MSRKVNYSAYIRPDKPRRAKMPPPPVDLDAPAGSELSPELARRIGQVEPTSMLDHALQWADEGVKVFPCARFLGIPLIDRWYREASCKRADVVEWWSEYPTADIGAVPDLSGHYVIVATGEAGRRSLVEIEQQYGPLPTAYRYENLHGDEHVWLRGTALTSHDRLGDGLHVLGAGHFVFLSPSLAPDHIWE